MEKSPLNHTEIACIRPFSMRLSSECASASYSSVRIHLSLCLCHMHMASHCDHIAYDSSVFFSSHFQPLLCPCARMNARWGKPTSTCESILFQWTISLKCLSVVTFKQIDDDDDGNDDDDYADALHMPYIYKYELIRCALFGAFARFHFVLFIRKSVKCHAYHLCSQIVE